MESNFESSSADLNSGTTLISKDTVLLCDWDKEIYQKCFGDKELQAWENISNLPNPELEKNRAHFERQKKS